jgi:hypothetical protein
LWAFVGLYLGRTFEKKNSSADTLPGVGQTA